MIFQQNAHDVFHPHSGVSKNAAVRRHLAGRLARACAWLSHFNQLRRQRIALGMLDDYMLADLGLSRSDVSRETAKWPWRE